MRSIICPDADSNVKREMRAKQTVRYPYLPGNQKPSCGSTGSKKGRIYASI